MRCRTRFWQGSRGAACAALLLALCNPVFAQNDAATQAPTGGETVSSTASSSAASSAPPEPPIYADSLARDNALLAKAFIATGNGDEIQWLETPDEKILALYKAAETAKPKGILVIMHAPETPQLWPSHLENLRRHLPLTGWATFALPLPAKYPASIPERASSAAASAASSAPADAAVASLTAPSSTGSLSTEASSTAVSASLSSTESSSASSSAKAIVARDKLIAARVDAAITHLTSAGQFNRVILVDNSSAPDALATLYATINASSTTEDTIDGPLQALILVNLQTQEPLSSEQLKAIFAVSALPVMDVFFQVDDKAQQVVRRRHQAAAMQQNIKDYQQLILPTLPQVATDDTQSFWLAKVHGFMNRKAEGSEIKGAKK